MVASGFFPARAFRGVRSGLGPRGAFSRIIGGRGVPTAFVVDLGERDPRSPGIGHDRLAIQGMGYPWLGERSFLPP
eukprot:15613968-Heterocapsa_arctica.AAC.1